MEQKLKYIPMGLLVAVSLKSLVVGLSWEAVASSLVLSGLWYLLEYKSNDKQLQALSNKMSELESNYKNTEAVLTDFRTSISSLRMTSGLSPSKFGRQGA